MIPIPGTSPSRPLRELSGRGLSFLLSFFRLFPSLVLPRHLPVSPLLCVWTTRRSFCGTWLARPSPRGLVSLRVPFPSFSPRSAFADFRAADLTLLTFSRDKFPFFGAPYRRDPTPLNSAPRSQRFGPIFSPLFPSVHCKESSLSTSMSTLPSVDFGIGPLTIAAFHYTPPLF